MPTTTSHYDVLQVPRDASPEVIRSAYKALAREYHPDLNHNSAEAHRLMQNLNGSFEVLDDPLKRAAHDEWISAHEKSWRNRARVLVQILARLRDELNARFGALGTQLARGLAGVSRRSAPIAPTSGFNSQPRQVEAHGRQPFRQRISAAGSGMLDALAALSFHVFGATGQKRRRDLHQTDSPWRVPIRLVLLGCWVLFATREQPTGFHQVAARKAAAAAYIRPATAPNGAPWPTSAAHVPGYPVHRDDGRSEVVVDNSQNPADAFVKLVNLDGPSPTAVRHLFIPARAVYRCTEVRKGHYQVTYQDLSSGSEKQSGPFELVERQTEAAVDHTVMKITLVPATSGKPGTSR